MKIIRRIDFQPSPSGRGGTAKRWVRAFAAFLTMLVTIAFAAPALGQQTGIPPFSSFSSGPFDVVNNANLNVHFSIPIVSKAGRGLPFSYGLFYDSLLWSPSSASGTLTWTPNPLWGWHGTEAATGYSYVPTSTTGAFKFQYGWGTCSSGATYFTFYDWTYTDPQGTTHSFSPGFSVQQTNSNCPDIQSTWGTTLASDGSGYLLCADATNTNQCGATSQYVVAATVTAPSGVVFSPYIFGSGTVKDTNGNTIIASATDNYTDTLDTTPVTVSDSGPPSGPITYTYQTTSGPANVTLNFSPYTVQTNFGCYGVTEFGPTPENLVSSITLPDGTSYTFNYEPTPGYAGNVTGRISSVTLPTGGTISYGYVNGTNNDGINCTSGSGTYLTRTVLGNQTWTYSVTGSAPSVTTVTDPQSNQTVYDFEGIYQTQEQINQGSSTLLETINTCYNGACNTAPTLPITQVAVTTQMDNGQQSETVSDYNSYGLPTEVDEYTFGQGTPGGLYRRMVTAYDTSLGNIQDRPATVSVYNSSSGLAAQTSYTYDSNGNLLTLSEDTGSGNISRSFTYGTGGVMATATDFAGHPTTFTNGDCNGAFPTSIAQMLSLTSLMTWDCGTGLVASVTDPNSQTTRFSYDELYRLTQTNNPDGGGVGTQYNDTSSPATVVTTTALGAPGNRQDTTVLDGLGRVTETQLNDPAGADKVDTSYDSLGRVASVSNPYRSSSTGGDTYSYDALGRVTSVTHADSNATHAYYGAQVSGNGGRSSTLCSVASGAYPSLGVDEDGNLRQYWTAIDGLLIEADEPDPANGSLTDSAATGTCYAYDALGNLTNIYQGTQTRTYSYDMLGRLTSATTPESGTTTYSYSGCSGDPNNVCTRTDARGITTTYTYDALNRLTSKSYSDGTPTAHFVYDETSVAVNPQLTVSPLTNTKGRLSHTWVGLSNGTYINTINSYDSMGRITSYWQCTPYNCADASIWQMTYNYDLAGDVASWTHPAGFTITNTINAAQQITQIASSLVDSTHPQYLAQNITYTPWGAESTLENGCAGSGCVNTVETYAYNNRLQPVMIELGTTANAAADYCLVYNDYASLGNPGSCAVPSQGTGDNGNVRGYLYQDNVNSSLGHTASYSYDSLNRLTNAAATGSSTYNFTSQYDRWGNMTCMINGQTNGPCPEYSFNSANNRITNTGYTYDAAGDLTSDTQHTYQWDAEGRLTSVDGGAGTIAWNALGQWMYWWTGNAPNYVYSPSGQDVGYYVPGSGWLDAMVPLGSRTLAGYPCCAWGTTMSFGHVNGLGSSMVGTYYNGSPDSASDVLLYPWGESWIGMGGFASLPDIDEAINADFGRAREYNYNQGRWFTPDRLGGDITNPQSLNRYAYALNNPTTLTDPTGLDSCWNHGSYEGSGSPPPCSYGAPVSYTLDGIDVPGSIAIGALQGGFALPGALAGTNAQLVSSPGSSAFEYANALQIGTETTATADLSGNVMGISYSPIYSNGLLNFSLPGIQFTTTSPTTATFQSNAPFWQTAGRFMTNGFQPAPLDLLNPYHPGQLSMRDNRLLCSKHVAITESSGASPGAPTTGDIHIDTVNPYPGWGLVFGPGGALAIALAHGAFDVFGGGIYPGAQACQ